MKYKKLPQAELEKLEKEFVQFLVSNSVTAEDWLKLQKENVDKVEELIGIFSDLVVEKVLEKVHYLEFRTGDDIKCFFCEKEQITLLGLKNIENSQLDFTKLESFEDFKQAVTNESNGLKVYFAKKRYNKNREEEIYGMMENGALKTDGWLYNVLAEIYSKK